LGSDEGRMQQNELMDLVTKLSDKCAALETDLRQTKKVYGDAFTRLIKKGKSMIEEIDQYIGITLVQINVEDQVTPIKEVSTGSGEISTAGVSMPVSTAGMVQEASTPSSVATKDKGSHPLQQLKKLSFDELKALFETTMRRVQTFDLMESKGEKIVPELTTGSSKRVAKVELDHEGSKKQKTNEASVSVQEQLEEEEIELSQEDLQQMMMVAPVEEVNVEALHVKYPIIDWEIYSEDTRRYWRI
ncbi:hypothetical protein Tco_1565779, partial [Tanacetum coccineum]